MSGTTMETKGISYELEIEIDASKAAVWQAITEETNAWWLPDFHMLGPDSTVEFDVRAGGSLVEQAGHQSSLLWYTIQMVQPEESLYLVGHIAPDFGGPATSMLRLKLTETAGKTTLAVQDAIFGHINESTATSLKEGWGLLFGQGLKSHLES